MPGPGHSTCGLTVGAKFTITKPIRYQEYRLLPGYTGVIESIDKAGDVLVTVSFPKDGDRRIWILNQQLPSLRIDEQVPGQFPSTPRKINSQMATLPCTEPCTEPVGEVLVTYNSPLCNSGGERGQGCASARRVGFCNGDGERGQRCASARRVGHAAERTDLSQSRSCATRGGTVQGRLAVGCRVTLEHPLRGLTGTKALPNALLGAGLQADICCIDESGDVLADFGTPYMQVWLSGADLWKLRVTKVAARRFWDHGREHPCKSGEACPDGNSGDLPSYSNFQEGGAARFGYADRSPVRSPVRSPAWSPVRHVRPAGLPSCRKCDDLDSTFASDGRAQFGYADCHVHPAGLPSCRTCDDLDSTFASEGRAMGNADLSDDDSWSANSF